MSDSESIKPKRKYSSPKRDPEGIKRNANGELTKHKGSSDPALQERQKILRTLELAAVDTPITLIASTLGETRSAIASILDEYKHLYPQLDKLPKLRQVRRDLVDASMYSSLESINNPEKIAEASLRDHAYAFDVLHRASRLEHNQSTSNTASLTFTQDAKSLDDL